MLNLMDPVSLEDLVLFRDDEDPRKFYLLPDQPVLSVDEKGVPDFYFIKYVYDATTHGDDQLGGGYVQFRTVLTVAPDRRDRVIAGLKQQLEQDKQAGKKPFGIAITATEPVLAAPLWTDGKVGLQTFKVGDKELVVKATETVPVDLAGSLGASVNLQLDSKYPSSSPTSLPIRLACQRIWRSMRIEPPSNSNFGSAQIRPRIIFIRRPRVTYYCRTPSLSRAPDWQRCRERT